MSTYLQWFAGCDTSTVAVPAALLRRTRAADPVDWGRAVSTAPLSRRVVYRVLAVVMGRPRRLDLVVCRLCGAVVVAHGIEQHAHVHAATGPNGHGRG